MAAGLLVLARPALAGPPERAGYWMSADVVSVTGGDDGLGEALELLQIGPEQDRPEGPGKRPSGAVVGRVDSIEQAFGYVERHAFARAVGFEDDRLAIHEHPAPAPGTVLYEEHGVALRAFYITGRTSDSGIREIDWPRKSEQVLPPHIRWRPARLWQETQVFAAPAAALPPARERFTALRAGSVAYVLGELDRCAKQTGCMRWAQVVAREGNRLVPGYVPAYSVVYDARPHDPVSIQPIAVGEGEAHFAIVFPERRLSRTLSVPHDSVTSYPKLDVIPPDPSAERPNWSVRHRGSEVLGFRP